MIQNLQNDQEPNVWPFVLPFAIYMLIALRSPSVQPGSIDDIAVSQYFTYVIVQCVVGAIVTMYFLPKILREFPIRIDMWGFVVGVVGVGLWIGICALGLEQKGLNAVGLGDWMPERVGFNPPEQMTDSTRRAIFLGFRFTLLAAIVPVVEELFLRGWLARNFEDEGWSKVKLTAVSSTGVLAVAVYALATHPGEALAAVVWFTLVSFLMIKTGKFWNCVVAHAVTNLLLGAYVMYTGEWHLW